MSEEVRRDGPLGSTIPHRLRRDEGGATTLELALLLAPFCILLFGTIEIAFVFWASYELENATDHAARLIRTGHVRQSKLDAIAFKRRLCSHVFVLADCASRLRLDVRSGDNFAVLPLPSQEGPGGNSGYAPGGPNQAVRVTAFYEWPLMTMISSLGVANLPNGNRLLKADTVFRNEPAPEE